MNKGFATILSEGGRNVAIASTIEHLCIVAIPRAAI